MLRDFHSTARKETPGTTAIDKPLGAKKRNDLGEAGQVLTQLIQLTQPSSLNLEDDAGDRGQVNWAATEVVGDQLIRLRSPSLAVFIGSAVIDLGDHVESTPAWTAPLTSIEVESLTLVLGRLPYYLKVDKSPSGTRWPTRREKVKYQLTGYIIAYLRSRER